mmetsp:Transcript_9672/g.19744  ORF Transcript_9672/g.19744 Transcript_9672/m.19744 type:complete len:197 (-) Transcript_9672:200-790(-)
MGLRRPLVYAFAVTFPGCHGWALRSGKIILAQRSRRDQRRTRPSPSTARAWVSSLTLPRREDPALDGEGRREEDTFHADEEPCRADCVVEIESEEEFQEFCQSGDTSPSRRRTSVLEVYANWCRPCIGMRRPFVNSCSEHRELQYLKLNADEFPHLAKALGIRALPTFIIFQDGHRVDHFQASSRERLDEYLEMYM